MKLYYHPLSIYSQKVLIACYEKGITFEPEIINLSDPVSSKHYSKIYPLGKIPLLRTDHKLLIPESSIIIEYLDQTHNKGTRLIPQDKDQARNVRFRDRMHDLYLSNPITIILLETMKPEAQRCPSLTLKQRQTLDIIYQFLNNELNSHSWSNGENFTMADCAAAPALFYAQRLYPFNKFPAINAYFSRLMGRPSFQKVIKEAEPLLKKFLY